MVIKAGMIKVTVLLSLVIGVLTTIIAVVYGGRIAIGTTVILSLSYAVISLRRDTRAVGFILRLASVLILSGIWAVGLGFILVRYILKV